MSFLEAIEFVPVYRQPETLEMTLQLSRAYSENIPGIHSASKNQRIIFKQ